MASKGVKDINMMILSIKIIFTSIFFNTDVEFILRVKKRGNIAEFF